MFLENWQRFLGTGEKNEQGESLEEFLKKYNARKYECPANTADMLVFRSEEPYRCFEQPLKLLMIRRRNHPSIGFWALPGGFVEIREDLTHAAARELQEETGVTGIPLVQLRTWGEMDRDPRWRVITTSFLALVEGELPVHAGDDAADALWFDVKLTGGAEEGSADAQAEIWKLELTNGERGISLGAEVKRTVTRRGILSDVRYKLAGSRQIANDHGVLIVDALLYLQKRCREAQ